MAALSNDCQANSQRREKRELLPPLHLLWLGPLRLGVAHGAICQGGRWRPSWSLSPCLLVEEGALRVQTFQLVSHLVVQTKKLNIEPFQTL